jgi:RNA-binding protein YlmH
MSVASAGFGLSRSKVMDMIAAGQVLLNWKEVGKAYNVQVITDNNK